MKIVEHTSILHFLYLLKVPKWIPEAIFFSWVIIIFLSLFSYFATRRFKKIPTPTQAVLEMVYEGLNNFTKNIITHKGERFTPLIGSLFIYILIMNLMGLVPGMLSPTANWNTTIALALVTLFCVIYFAIREHGVKRFIKHLCGEPLWLAPIALPGHLISEFFGKPFSLSLRLFANIFSKEIALLFLVLTMPLLIKFIIPAPIYLFVLLLGILTSLIQALIFALLSAVYIEIMTGEH